MRSGTSTGLPPVRQDRGLSAGCAAYDRYRHLNGGVQDAFTPGPEQPGKPGYTTAGARASRDSLLNAGDRPADSWANGDVFDDAPGHLFSLMSPDVTVIGVDQLDVDLGSFLGTAHVSCVDVRSARRRGRPRHLRVFHDVGPAGRLPDPPLSYREGPFRVGPVVFVYFMLPRGATVTLRSLQLRHRDGVLADPPYVRLTGGMRDGRNHPNAHASNQTGAPPVPAAAVGLGPSYTDLLQIAILCRVTQGISNASVRVSQGLLH
jgi:hypothetical protein